VSKKLNITEIFIDADLGSWGDIDGDGEKEQIYATIFAIEAYKKGKRLWNKRLEAKKAPRELPRTEERMLPETRIGEIITKISAIDLTNNGKDEILVGRADGILGALDGRGKTLWAVDLGDYIRGFVCEDVNKDGKPEIVVITGHGVVFLLNARGKKVWSREYPREYAPNDVCVGDINNDKRDEIVLAMKDGTLIIINNKGKVIKELHILREPVTHIKILDFNQDDRNEIIACGEGGSLVILDQDGVELERYSYNSRLINLSVFDVNNDGYPEIIAGDWEGALKIINNQGIITQREARREIEDDIDDDGQLEKIVRYWKKIIVTKGNKELWAEEYARWVSAIEVSDINGDGKKEILVGALDKVFRIYSVTGELLWATRTLRSPFSILAEDIDDDNMREIIIVGERELRIYKVQ